MFPNNQIASGQRRRRPSCKLNLTWSLLFLVLASAGPSGAIVKSGASSSSSSGQPISPAAQQQAQPSQQQQRSDNVADQQAISNNNNNQVSFNNHQVGSAPQQGRPNQIDLGFQGKPYANADQMSAAASNSEQSYQAAAQSVNMALANSGILPASAPVSGQQQSANGQQQQQQQSNSAAGNLNPLHYFYYPAAKESSVAAATVAAAAPGAGNQQAAGGSNKPQDSYLSSMNAYQSYADQLNAGLAAQFAGSAGAPEAAASNQDPSYLPQPSDQQMNNNQQQQVGNGMQQPQQQYYSQGNQQQHSQQQYNGMPDLSSYASNMNPAAAPAPGGLNNQQVSFNGAPSSMNDDFLNSHAGHQMAPQQQQQQQQPATDSRSVHI